MRRLNGLKIPLVVSVLAISLVTGCSIRPATTSNTEGSPTKGAGFAMTLTSPAFTEGQKLPERFAMQGVPGGGNTSIPYAWSSAPSGTESFALILVDEAPVARRWVHWLVVDIPPTVSSLPEGASGSPGMPSGARELENTFGFAGYGGPQPPPGTGEHPYVATIYALDAAAPDMPARVTAEQFERAVAGHVLAKAALTGTFGR